MSYDPRIVATFILDKNRKRALVWHDDNKSERTKRGEVIAESGTGLGPYKGGREGAEKERQKKQTSSTMQIPVIPYQKEDGVDQELAETVISFIIAQSFEPEGELLIVTGENWTCYIRCVLHGLNRIDAYAETISQVEEAHIVTSSGVTLGTEQEGRIREIIMGVTGLSYRANATDARHGNTQEGIGESGNTVIRLLLTGVHFSLIR